MKESVLQDAIRLRRAGRLAEAAQLYDDILKDEPRHFEALHALGILRYQGGQFEEAERLIGLAVAVRPDVPDALYNRGCLLQRLSRPDEALGCFDKALSVKPGYVEALINRGATLMMLKRPADALADFESVARAHPQVFEAWSSSGGALLALGRPADALSSFDRALAIRGDSAQAWRDRAAALLALARPMDALASFTKALQLVPNNPEVLFAYADTLLGVKRFGEAARAYEKFLSIVPNHATAWNHRGVALVELKQHDEALACFDRSLALDGNDADAWANRGNALSERKRYAEAARDYENALRLAPSTPYILGYLAQCRVRSCDWRSFEEDREQLAAGVRAGRPVIDPMGNLAISRSPDNQLRCARIFMSDEPRPPPLWQGELYRHEKIRVAYLSADYRPHAVAFLIAGVFEHHDRNRFETIGISFGPGAGTDIRARIEKGCDRFIDVREAGEADIASMLRQMEVDIAVDLMGFTDGCRPGILAFRPAPIQVNFLGFPGTMGADHIDYILADRILIPEDERQFYSEQVVYLPDTYQANDSKRRIAEKMVTRAEAGLPESGFVFCSFNNNYKITPDVFDIWMRLVNAVEGSVLWLLEDHASVAGNLRREAEARGVSPKRLVFAPRVPPPDHLARQRLADLFLDTLPYGAHVTASDALWMGLPVVTCSGTTFAGRVAASLLSAIGVPELVTQSFERYEALALNLARDPFALAALKEKLARHRDTYPLFDTARFARHLESAFATMRARQRRGEQPMSFVVSPESVRP